MVYLPQLNVGVNIMDWFFTKVFDYRDGVFVENKNNTLYGMSSLSGGGAYAIVKRLDEEAVQRGIDNQYYPFTFKVLDEDGDTIAEGIAEDSFDDKPLRHAHDFLMYQFEISSIEYYANGELVNVILVDDLEDDLDDGLNTW